MLFPFLREFLLEHLAGNTYTSEPLLRRDREKDKEERVVSREEER